MVGGSVEEAQEYRGSQIGVGRGGFRGRGGGGLGNGSYEVGGRRSVVGEYGAPAQAAPTRVRLAGLRRVT